RTLPCEFRQAVAERDDFVDAFDVGEDAMQLDGRFEDHAATARRDQRDITREMDRVAETLLGMDQDCLTVQFLAAPLRRAEAFRCRDVPAPAMEAFGKLALHEQREPVIPMRAFMRRVDGEGAFIALMRGRRVALLQQHIAEIDMRVDRMRLQRNRFAEMPDSSVELVALREDTAEIVMRGGICRLQREDALIAGCGLIALAQLVERGAEIVERVDVIGIECQRLAIMLDRLRML